MTTTWSGLLVGAFYGYRGGFVYELSDGSSWIQKDETEEPACCEYPAAFLLSDGRGKTYLRVDGTVSRVRVVRRFIASNDALCTESLTHHHA